MESNERLEMLDSILANLGDSVYAKDYFQGDAFGEFAFVNEQKAKNAGVTVEEMIGRTDFDFMSENEAQESLENELLVLKTGVPIIDREQKRIMADGTLVIKSVTIKPWFMNGSLRGVVGVSRDITDRKKIEHMQINGMLIQDHDIKNSITVVRGYAQFMMQMQKDGNLHPDQLLEYLQQIIDGADSITTICNQLQLRGQAMVEGFTVCKSECDLRNDIINPALEVWKKEMEKKKIRIEGLDEIKPGDLILNVDKELFAKVIDSHLHNFLKYGGDVWCFALQKSDASVALTIGNNGPDIPDCHLMYKKNKMEMRRPKNAGSGWGMYISSQLIKSHDGTIECANTQHGPEFTITMPI